MELIVDKVEVVTVWWDMMDFQTGKQRVEREIQIRGHLSTDYFPYLVDWRSELPAKSEEDPHYYGKGWEQLTHDQIWTAPFSAEFVCNVVITHWYGALLPAYTKEGTYKIALQASWVPFLLLPASNKVILEVNTRGRNDRDEHKKW